MSTPSTERKKSASLRDILALPVDVRIGDATLAIRPASWTQMAQSIEHLTPAMQELPLVLAAYKDMPQSERVGAWMGVALAHRTTLLHFAADVTDLDPDDVAQLTPLQFVDLLMAIFELNIDFFVSSLPALTQRLEGRIQALKPKLEEALKQAQATAAMAALKAPSSA